MMRKRKVSVTCRVALSVLAALGVSLLSASAAEFKATVSYRTPEKTETFPLSVKGSKSRMDRTIDGRQTVIIVDQERGTVQPRDVAERKYGQFPLGSFEGAFFLSLPGIIAFTAAMPGMETKPLGTETVSGYSCEKFAIVSKDDPTFSLLTYWISQKLGYPLKIAYDPKGENVIEVTNIQENPLEDSLFQVPSGYTLAETPAAPPMPDLPAWVQEVPSAPFVTSPYQQRMSAGEIIRVRAEAGKKIEVSGVGETENEMDASFTAAAFRSGKPVQDLSYTTSTASKWGVSTFGFDNTPQETDEIVVRVNKGVVLIGVKQCGLEEDDCPDLADVPDVPDVPEWVREAPSAPLVTPPHQQRMSVGEMIRVKVEPGKQTDIAGKGETENPEDANFQLVPFSGGKPVEVYRPFSPPGSEPYPTYPAFVGPVDQLGPVHHLRGESEMEQGADEIVVRVNKGVVLIEVKQCGFETVVRRYCPGWPD